MTCARAHRLTLVNCSVYKFQFPTGILILLTLFLFLSVVDRDRIGFSQAAAHA